MLNLLSFFKSLGTLTKVIVGLIALFVVAPFIFGIIGWVIKNVITGIIISIVLSVLVHYFRKYTKG